MRHVLPTLPALESFYSELTSTLDALSQVLADAAEKRRFTFSFGGLHPRDGFSAAALAPPTLLRCDLALHSNGKLPVEYGALTILKQLLITELLEIAVAGGLFGAMKVTNTVDSVDVVDALSGVPGAALPRSHRFVLLRRD